MKIFKILAIVFVVLILLGAGSAVGIYFWAAKDLPGFKKITDYNPPLTTTVYSCNNKVLGYFSKERRFLVPLKEVSAAVPKAFLAAEDSDFYEHEGVDLMGIFRAALKNLKAGSIVQGGSTITQQVIKSLLLTPERSYERKLKEAILAYRLEKYLSKDEILTIYLNQIYFGASAYGIESAARTYFAKHASELDVAEAAVLAGLPKAPSRYNPYRHPQVAKSRQEYVLDRMLEMDYISEQEYEQALNKPLEYQRMADPSWGEDAYYLEEVRRWLIDRFGEKTVYEGGLHVYTAADLKHQAVAQKAVRDGLRASTKRRGWQGPVKQIKEEQFEAFLASEESKNEKLLNGEWIKVLVTKVQKAGAEVRFSEHKGRIDVQSMSWARTPDPSKAPEEVRDIKDARKVLNIGDVVWASLQEKEEDKQEDQDKDKEEQQQREVWQLKLEQEPRVEGALVSMDPKNGEVKALVGGYSFERSQYNRATQAKRQPGSAFKPIVYSTALDNGYTPATKVLDAPIVYNDQATNSTWKPENFEGVFYGPTILRTALVKSRNLVTIRIARQLGIGKIIQRARDLGLEGEFPRDLSVSLGSASVSLINLCQAYSAFARNDGSIVKPRLVLQVNEPWGEELYKAEPEVKPAISKQTSYIIASLLQQVVSSGTGWRIRALGRPVAGKTGTTDDEQDAWFMGFAPYLLTGVYVGFDEVKPMGKYETGSRAASPIWLQYRQAVKDEYEVEEFKQPRGIVRARIDVETGLLAGPNSEKVYSLPFKAGTQPTKKTSSNGQEGSGSDSESGSGSGEQLLKQVY